MSTPSDKKSQVSKKPSLQNEELRTDSPLSEKDEVKAAEQRTSKLNNKANTQNKPHK